MKIQIMSTDYTNLPSDEYLSKVLIEYVKKHKFPKKLIMDKLLLELENIKIKETDIDKRTQTAIKKYKFYSKQYSELKKQNAIKLIKIRKMLSDNNGQ